MGDFRRCASVVLAKNIEGGFVNNPHDPGGATNHGITIAVLSAWRGHACTVDDVRALQLPEAMAIFEKWYFRAVDGPDLPSGVDLITFDAAVNQGAGRAARWLQVAAGAVEDGHVGPATLAAVAARGAPAVVDGVRSARLAAYKADKDWAEFGEGWCHRLADITMIARKWAGEK